MNSALKKRRARERRQQLLAEFFCWSILAIGVAVVAPLCYKLLVFIMLF